MSCRICFHLMTLLFTLLSCVWMAQPSLASELSVFVDFDGDGFDDREPDDDLDGIPDQFERHGFITAPVTTLEASTMFGGSAPALDPPLMPGNAEKYGKREFATRALRESRSNFDTGFGSDLGVGSGLGVGGACAGGICY